MPPAETAGAASTSPAPGKRHRALDQEALRAHRVAGPVERVSSDLIVIGATAALEAPLSTAMLRGTAAKMKWLPPPVPAADPAPT